MSRGVPLSDTLKRNGGIGTSTIARQHRQILLNYITNALANHARAQDEAHDRGAALERSHTPLDAETSLERTHWMTVASKSTSI